MKTELVMDVGEEKKEPFVSAQTLENKARDSNAPEAPSIIATSLLDRFFDSSLARKIASGVLGALSFSPVTAAHADKIITNQAAADVFAGQAPGPTVDKIASPEQQILTEYPVRKFAVSGSRIAAVVDSLDGKTRVGIGDIDVNGNLVLKETASLPFYPLDVKISKNNPNLIVAVGDEASRAGKGWNAVSRDGGQSWQTEKTNGLTAYRVELTPDDEYEVIVEADRNQENPPNYRYKKLASDTPAQLAKVVSTSSGVQVNPYLVTQLTVASQSGEYEGVGTGGARRGYFKMKFSLRNGMVTSENLHQDEGFSEGDLVSYEDQGKRILWLIINHSAAFNDPNLPRGTVMINVDDVLTWRVQPELIQPGFDIADIKAVAVNSKKTEGYLGSDVMFSNERENRTAGRVEKFDTSAPDDLSKRMPASQTGWPEPQKPKESIKISDLDVVESGGKEFLVAGVNRTERVYDPVENTSGEKIIGGGVFVQDITGGMGKDGAWKRVTLDIKMKYHTYLPLVARVFGGGW